MELDLTKPVLGKVGLRGHFYKVVYEGLHLLCSHCGFYGHLGRNCPTAHKSLSEDSDEVAAVIKPIASKEGK